jgi:rSAM/selenodomain-associated transferase 1
MRHLIIFIKNAAPGRVKTRLAATVGDVRALEVYLKLLAITRTVALEVDCQRRLYYSDRVEEEDDWSGTQFDKHVQQGNDLGERIHDAFTTSFAKGASKVIVVGSDCPELSAAIVEDAFDALERHDVVVGPAVDGGYYLLGMKTAHISLFENMKWSTSTVLEDTLARVSKLELNVKMLPQLSDLDTEQDLRNSGL